MYGSQTQSGHGFGQPNAGRGYQDFNSNPRGGVRSYEMEDIYGRGGQGRASNNQYGQYNQHQNNYNQNQQFGQNNQFQNNQFQQQPMNGQFQNYNQQDFQNQQNNQSIYEHLTPQYPQDPYAMGQQNMAYDPYDNNQNLPGY
jgi:hypothetical protein